MWALMQFYDGEIPTKIISHLVRIILFYNIFMQY